MCVCVCVCVCVSFQLLQNVNQNCSIRPFNGKFLVYAEAAIKVLGISAYGRINMTISSLSFEITGNLWNVFEVCHLFVSCMGWLLLLTGWTMLWIGNAIYEHLVVCVFVCLSVCLSV